MSNKIRIGKGVYLCQYSLFKTKTDVKHNKFERELGQTGECKANVARQIQMDGREPKNIAKFALPIVLEDPHGRVQGK